MTKTVTVNFTSGKPFILRNMTNDNAAALTKALGDFPGGSTTISDTNNVPLQVIHRNHITFIEVTAE